MTKSEHEKVLPTLTAGHMLKENLALTYIQKLYKIESTAREKKMDSRQRNAFRLEESL